MDGDSARKLGGVSGADLSVYVNPDLGSIASRTGHCGEGHAVVEARAPHVVRSDPAVGGRVRETVGSGRNTPEHSPKT